MRHDVRLTRALRGLLLVAAPLAGCGGDASGPAADPCGNAAGNGEEVVTGPAAPVGDDHDQTFRSLAVDPANADFVYVGTERNGVVRSRDGGRTWERLRRGMRHAASGYPEVYDLAVATTDPDLVIAATADSPGPLTGSHPSAIAGIYRSTDAGDTWQRANCGLENGSVGSVRFVPGSSSTVVLGVSGGVATFSAVAGRFFPGGLYRSTDGGRNWGTADAPDGIERSLLWHIKAARVSGELFAVAVDHADVSRSIGFLRSDDGGVSWQPLDHAMTGRFIDEFDVSTDGRTIYANDRFTTRLLRTRDGGASWSEVGAFGNGVVALSPADAELVLFEDFGTLRRSTDGLATHAIVLVSARRFDDIEFAPSNPSVVYAVTEGYDVYRSDDAGASFRLLLNLRTTVLR